MNPKFPPHFLFGAATSAYQIEGSPLADGAAPSNWHQFTNAKGRGHVTLEHDGNIACDHYRRFRDDVRLMADLGINAYRFSISWSRVLPLGTGHVHAAGLDFYEKLVDELLRYGIVPMATLFHWDLPAELAARGGWMNPEIVHWFRDYATVVFQGLADRVPFWVTINEPWVISHMGYMEGIHPPGVRDFRQLPRVAAHLLQAHDAAIGAYREIGQHAIGIVVNLAPQHPATSTMEDVAAAARADAYFNRQFLQPLCTGSSPAELSRMFGDAWVEPFCERRPLPIDFVGVNYYTRVVVQDGGEDPFRFRPVRQVDRPHTEMGWEVYPEGLTELLVGIRRDYGDMPIFVTENGAAFADRVDEAGQIADEERVRYLHDHLHAAQQALAAGVPLRGYFAWSFLDNFEWSHGYTKRFGLVYVDFVTQQRIPKASARYYQAICANGHWCR